MGDFRHFQPDLNTSSTRHVIADSEVGGEGVEGRHGRHCSLEGLDVPAVLRTDIRYATAVVATAVRLAVAGVLYRHVFR